jgi:glycosyltransferase involved in cell wall biosynthesis
MKISVVMASFLGMPQRTNLDLKFKRAVNSFLNQSYEDKELLIISDGCEKTIQLYSEFFGEKENVKLIPIPKQPYYSGIMRNIAFQIAEGDMITYLDSDDVLGKDHLNIIKNQFDFDKMDWCYYNDYLVLNKEFTKLQTRVVDPRWSSIGTSSVAHKHPRLLKNGEFLKWQTGYSHDFVFVMKLASLGYRFKKLETSPQYLVAHYHSADF